MGHELIDDLLVRAPVIRKAAEVRDDKVHVAVFWRQHFDDRRLSGDIDEKWKAVSARGLADLAGRHGLMAMNFDPAKSPLRYRAFKHRHDAPLVAG